jgi:hypothetical protein
LGLAPLSKLDEKTDKNLEERVLTAVKRLGRRYYSFAGLEQFKGKFDPEWSPRYILYPRNGLLPVAAALNTVTTYRPNRAGRGRRWLVFAAALAGIVFMSFPLAWLLNPRYANSALASHLGEPGQPYAWLFDALDVVSGLLSTVVLLECWRRLRSARHLQRLWAWVLGLTIASSIGTIAAALITLPAGYVEIDSIHGIHVTPQLVGHAAGSFVSSAGFVAAVVLWAVGIRKVATFQRRQLWLRWLLAALIVLSSTAGYVIGDAVPAVSPFIQRLFIGLYALWLPWLVYDVLFVVSRNKATKATEVTHLER